MKNKIILLLVLLIPSLCFGLSLKIEVIKIRDQILRVTFLSSNGYSSNKLLSAKNIPEGAVDFFTRERKIEFSKQDDFKVFTSILRLHLPNRADEIFKKYSISENSIISYFTIENLIQDLAVVNNYQISLLDRRLDNTYIFRTFLYKPDN